MNDQAPLVSVLMTAYNREKYISAAIESVLNSTYTNLELIISDDCSADNTVNIAKAFSKKDARTQVFVNEQNLGDYPNRNKAASYAKGKYIKYLDSDDILYPHGLEVMVGAMEKFPSAGYGLSCSGDPKKPYPTCIEPHEAYMENFYGFKHFDRAPGSAIIKKDAFDKVGGFSGKRMIGDYELWFRLGRVYPLVKFPVDLYWSRQHPQQESGSGYATEYVQLRKQVLEEALGNPDCPLNGEEKKSVIKKMKSVSLKDSFLKIIRQ